MSFWHDQRGNTAMIFAICLIPLLAIAGGAMDMTRHRTASVETQAALDAALLHVAHGMGERSIEELKLDARQIFDQQMVERGFTLEDFDIVQNGDDITATVDGEIQTTLLGLIGIGTLNVSRISQVRYSERQFEIALALDTTGSMAGDKIVQLRAAAKLLVDKIDAGTSKTANRRFALVPFTTWVNVGPENWNEDWIDQDGRSDVSATNLLPRTSRTALYEALGEAWPGCVEAREYPLDVDDTLPERRKPETLFAPSFYPDEPDDRRRYANDYLDDGLLSWNAMNVISDVTKYGVAIIKASTGRGRAWGDDDDDDDDRGYGNDDDDDDDERRGRRGGRGNVDLKRTYRFYSDVTTPIGPGFNCSTRPIVPLTRNASLIKSEIDQLHAEGSTNLTEGVAWGWRTLSPERPFTGGAPYDDRGVDKVLVVLSDGNNHISARGDMRGSDYSAYGYAANGRLNVAERPSQDEIWTEMDERTVEACTNAKRAGIIVYAVRLELKDERSDGVLSACASSPDKYLDVPEASELDEAFSLIADDVLQLYLAK
ncbi:pilus assembly protein [Henriciella marina]|uniref:pilus assembly protein n=1 Tax=Henriciella marina TaxID=453851 RepID=UPI00036FF9A2|nr:pilus assembly protein [Henriciella marina]